MTRDMALARRCTVALVLTFAAACSGIDPAETGTSTEAALTTTGAVLTQHNDASRTGLNSNETTLTPTNVRTAFGKLFTIPVVGRIFAQPLYAPQVSTLGGVVRDLIIIATEANNVYAFDSHDGTLIWTRNLGTPIPSAEAYGTECVNIPDGIGITGTPVIDPASGTLYLVAATKTGTDRHEQNLHALDVATGTSRTPGMQFITAQMFGDGFDIIAFDPVRANQRAGLLFMNGKVYIAWASHCDDHLDAPNPQIFFGWVMSYDGTTLNQDRIFNASRHKNPSNTQEPYGSSIWLGAGGIPSDGNKVYVNTGNGLYDPDHFDYGDSTLGLNLTLGMSDSFTPADQLVLDAGDLDVSSAGIVLLPESVPFHPHLLVTAGKEGTIYVLDRDNLGGAQVGADLVCPTNQAATGCVVARSATAALGTISGNRYFGLPAYWHGHLYFAGNGDTLKRFDIGVSPILSGVIAHTGNVFGYPGTTPSISSSGDNDAIVWALERAQRDSGVFPDPTHLHAYDPLTLAELYKSGSGLTTGPDDPTNVNQFLTPTIAGGQVIVGSKDSVAIYGLHLAAAPASHSIVQGTSATYTVSTAFANPATNTALSIGGTLPTGLTAAFAPATVASGASSSLTLTTSATTPVGNYMIQINGLKNGVTHSTTVALEVTADQPPTAGFTFYCVGRQCNFSGASSHDDVGIVSGLWDFGDGSTLNSPASMVQHTFASNNVYRVTLTVIDARGQSGMVAHGVTAVDRPPTAMIGLSCTGATCAVNSGLSTDDVGITNYAWSFGDGTPLASGPRLRALKHTYVQFGNFTITLTVTDSAGQRATAAAVAHIAQVVNTVFTSTCTGRTCAFDASASFFPPAIVDYFWDFGDGTTGEVQTPTIQHTFTSAGTYNVQLTVFNPSDASQSTTSAVTVQ